MKRWIDLYRKRQRETVTESDEDQPSKKANVDHGGTLQPQRSEILSDHNRKPEQRISESSAAARYPQLVSETPVSVVESKEAPEVAPLVCAHMLQPAGDTVFQHVNSNVPDTSSGQKLVTSSCQEKKNAKPHGSIAPWVFTTPLRSSTFNLVEESGESNTTGTVTDPSQSPIENLGSVVGPLRRKRSEERNGHDASDVSKKHRRSTDSVNPEIKEIPNGRLQNLQSGLLLPIWPSWYDVDNRRWIVKDTPAKVWKRAKHVVCCSLVASYAKQTRSCCAVCRDSFVVGSVCVAYPVHLPGDKYFLSGPSSAYLHPRCCRAVPTLVDNLSEDMVLGLPELRLLDRESLASALGVKRVASFKRSEVRHLLNSQVVQDKLRPSAVVKSLTAWRQRAATQLRVTPGKLLNNRQLLSLAAAKPKDKNELFAVVNASITRAYPDAILAAIREAVAKESSSR